MAYNETLANRIRLSLSSRNIRSEEKNMMGGLTFMIDSKMCLGVIKDDLMARIDPLVHENSLTKTGCREMDFTGRPMKGYVFVDSDGTNSDESLSYWINLALEFNPKAKASKRKTSAK